MNQVLHIPFIVLGVLTTLLAPLVLVVQLAAAQGQDEARGVQAFQPLTAAEIQQAVTVLRSENRVQTSLARGQRVRTTFVERHEESKDAPTGQRRANVVLYNYDTNETISAVVTLRPSPRAEHLTVTQDQPPGLSTEEGEEAKQLALAHPIVQGRLQAVGLAGPGRKLIITHIRIQAVAPDPCATHRCVILFFNTPDTVLDIQPVVDLTTGRVEVQ